MIIIESDTTMSMLSIFDLNLSRFILLFSTLTCLAFSCAPGEFEPFEEPKIPPEVQVPPVAEKHMALQSIFDTIDFAVRLNKELCNVYDSDNKPREITCASPIGDGSVKFFGVLTQKGDVLEGLGRELQGSQRDLRITRIEFD